MASGDKPRTTGRVTPKGSISGRAVSKVTGSKVTGSKVTGSKVTGSKGTGAKGTSSQQSSGRYTPPIPKEYKVSPMWVPVLMFTLLGIGMLMIVCNYLGVLPGGAKNAYLLAGLGSITGGFITATRYH